MEKRTNGLEDMDYLEFLSDEERKIIKMRYIECKKWYMVSREICRSERATIDRAEEALEKMGKILFERGWLYEKYRNNI